MLQTEIRETTLEEKFLGDGDDKKFQSFSQIRTTLQRYFGKQKL